MPKRIWRVSWMGDTSAWIGLILKKSFLKMDWQVRTVMMHSFHSLQRPYWKNAIANCFGKNRKWIFIENRNWFFFIEIGKDTYASSFAWSWRINQIDPECISDVWCFLQLVEILYWGTFIFLFFSFLKWCKVDYYAVRWHGSIRTTPRGAKVNNHLHWPGASYPGRQLTIKHGTTTSSSQFYTKALRSHTHDL